MEFRNIARLLEKKGADYSDLRLSRANVQNFVLENGQITQNVNSSSQGYGLRCFSGAGMGFAFGIEIKNLKAAALKALKLAKVSKLGPKLRIPYVSERANVKSKAKDPFNISDSDKLDEIERMDSLLKNKIVKSRTISMGFRKNTTEIYNSCGSEVIKESIYSLLRSGIVVKRGARTESVSSRFGGNLGYDSIKKIDKADYARDLIEKAKRQLIAKPAPTGSFPVILDNRMAGLFFHECIGHACEADHILKQTSVFWDKIGEEVAIGSLSLSDNPLVLDEGGGYLYDDEGVKSREKFIIKEGIVSELLHSMETAAVMGQDPSGNGRAMDFSSLCIPRMSNLILKKGDYSFKELVDVDFGVYIKGFKGGEVNPHSGTFVFAGEEGFLIKKGKILQPLKETTLGGSILQILSKIDAIGDDVSPTFAAGHCGKEGQFVPVGEIMPHIRIKEAVIGGKCS